MSEPNWEAEIVGRRWLVYVWPATASVTGPPSHIFTADTLAAAITAMRREFGVPTLAGIGAEHRSALLAAANYWPYAAGEFDGVDCAAIPRRLAEIYEALK